MARTFRLRMATPAGEDLAKRSGADRFPVDPIAIAVSHDIHLEAKAHTGGVSGVFQLVGNAAFILYEPRPQNPGFERFCIAHELGHYFLPGHPEEILANGGTHISRANFIQGASPIEIEADHFAAGLLMPRALVRPLLSNANLGLEAVLALSSVANTSLTAAAIRVAECADFPICIIVSRGDEVAYAFPSTDFKKLGKRVFLRKGSPLPTTSTTRAFNADNTNVLKARQHVAETTLGEWFDNGSNLPLDEEIVGLGDYGFTLTVLSSEALQSGPDGWQDEDVELERTWIPRFAYGR